MRTKIFYFSGTGNSLIVAKHLAESLGKTELVSIPRVINSNIDTKADRIGIVFPVYAWGPPKIVKNFIGKLAPDGKEKYFFTVATYGGFPGGALLKVAKLLKRRGLKLDLGMGIRLPGNCISFYGAWPENKQKKLFDILKNRVNEIAANIQNNNRSIIERNFFLVNLLSSLMYKGFMSKVSFGDKSFWISEKCTNCGICNRICPVNNIKVENGKRTWLHNCEQCMACIQWCPAEAIQYGNKTATRKRYHHPDVKAQDLFVR